MEVHSKWSRGNGHKLQEKNSEHKGNVFGERMSWHWNVLSRDCEMSIPGDF